MATKTKRKPPRKRRLFVVRAPSAPPTDPAQFDEAVDFFRRRVPMVKSEWLKLGTAARQRGFTAADVLHLDVMNSVWLALDDAIAKGATFDEFKKTVTPTLVDEWGGRVGNPPARIECLPGDALVDSAMVRAVHRRAYQGPMFEAVTANGRKFSATPNHPMLTRRGWIGAGALREGDDLVGHDWQHDASARRDEYVAAEPTRIDELFRAVAVSGTVERVLGADHDFHGDGRDGDVDIARPFGTLQIGRFAALTKPIGHNIFADSDVATLAFCRRCEHLIVWSKRCGFCDAAVSRTGALKSLRDGAMRRIERLGEIVRAFAGSIAAQQFVGRDVLSVSGGFSAALEMERPRIGESARDTGLVDCLGEQGSSHSNERDYFRKAQPASVKFDRVVALRSRDFSGHVFNLSTVCGYFTIDGLYTGNTIFRTNVLAANNAGRHAQMTDPAILNRRPFWQYVDIDDARECPICTACHGTILPATSEWWQTHTPPQHFQCRCRFRPLTVKQAEAAGVTIDPTQAQADEGFGVPPQEVAPPWQPDLSKYPPELAAIAREKMAHP